MKSFLVLGMFLLGLSSLVLADDSSNDDYYTGAKIVFGIFVGLFGLVFTFVGYRIFKKTVVVLGFVAGFCFTCLLLSSYTELEWYWITLIGIPAGLIAGIICFFLISVAIFAVGAFVGFIILLVLFAFIATWVGEESSDTTWFLVLELLCASIAGVIGGLLTLAYQRVLLIICTAGGGSYLAVAALDYFVQDGSFSQILVEVFNGESGAFASDWEPYVMVAAWFVLAIFGILVQWFGTAKSYHHQGSKHQHYHTINA